jgi:DNA/RNA endonuclease G (NUC1)
VFGKNDIAWRQDVIADFKVPLKFWKVVVWKDGVKLKARAMLADQSIALPKVLPEVLLPESFDDTEPVADFIVSIAEIEKLTGLTFSATLRRADLGKAEKRPREVRRAGELLRVS